MLALLVAVAVIAADPVGSDTNVVRLAEGLEVHERGSNAARKYGINAPSLAWNSGEIRGTRDIQGGMIIDGLPQLNALDIGAGNAERPGRLGIGADVTRTIVFSVRRPNRPPQRMMSISPRGITFYVKPRLRRTGCSASHTCGAPECGSMVPMHAPRCRHSSSGS